MTLTLSKTAIVAALPELARHLPKYLWLQAERDRRDLRRDAEFRQRFCGFYRVRRDRAWLDAFFDLFERSKGRTVSFVDLVETLHRKTGRYEASFASKLLATLDPRMPVIDSVVMRNLGLRLPSYGSARRQARIVEVHDQLSAALNEFLGLESGRNLVAAFRAKYPGAAVTEMKMLDLVLWQTRPKKFRRGQRRSG